MSVTVDWDADRTAIIYHFEKQWAWGDYYNAMIKSRDYMDECQSRVPSIYDLRETSILPTGSIPALRPLIENRHPNAGMVVILGDRNASPLILLDTLFKTLKQRYNNDWTFVYAKTLSEAYGLIQRAGE